MPNQPPRSCAQACRKLSGAAVGIPTPGFRGEREATLPQTPPFLPTLLSQGWTWHSPSCYWLGEDPVTYGEARRLCTDHGSQLVTITNRYEGGPARPDVLVECGPSTRRASILLQVQRDLSFESL